MPNLDDVEGTVLEQDVVWVMGGSVANLLAVWRVHGLDRVMRRAWESGVVLSGVSAGSLCWFEGGTTDSYGPELQPLDDGLGFLAGSLCPHYDAVGRRPLYHRTLLDGSLPAGYAMDNFAMLEFDGTTLVGAVASDPDQKAFQVRVEDGRVVEDPIPVKLLERRGDAGPPPPQA